MSTVVTVIHKNLNLPNHQLYIPDQGRKSCECYDACITGHGQVEVDGGIGPRQYPFASATGTSSLISLTLSVRNLSLPPLLDSKPSLLQIKPRKSHGTGPISLQVRTPTNIALRSLAWHIRLRLSYGDVHSSEGNGQSTRSRSAAGSGRLVCRTGGCQYFAPHR